MVCCVTTQQTFAFPSFEEIRNQWKSSEQIFLDRNGVPLQELRINKTVRKLDWISLKEISPVLVATFIAAEDKRFYSHWGVDPLAMFNALSQGIIHKNWRGASTISMQVASFVDELSHRGKRKTHRQFAEKLQQMWTALSLERSWSKEQILEAYLNLVYFRGELQGVAAASYGLFAKAPFAIIDNEARILAALIRSPNAKVEAVMERACRLQIRQSGDDDCQSLKTFAHATFQKSYQIASQFTLAMHFAQKLKREHPELAGNSTIHTTIDADLQKVATQSLRAQIMSLRSQNMSDGALIILENATGNVLAYVGNIGPESTAPYVDGAKARRQAGSTLKPFLYGRAIEKRLITASTLLRDSPIGISVQTGTYQPENYDRSFKQLVSARVALASSLNIPAVRMIEMLGQEDFVNTLTNFGFQNLYRADFYGPSIALGSADITLWDIANAYRTLANRGKWSPVNMIKGATPDESRTRQVMDPGAAYIISKIISDRESRSLTFGLENMLATRYWTAVKTGTSKDMRDNWCIGFSDKYTVAVWAGNFSGDPMWNVSGVQGAAPVWLDMMNYLHQRQTSVEPPAPGPESVHMAQVYFPHNGVRQNEWYLPGTEPNNGIVTVNDKEDTRIVYPAHGAIIALDPNLEATKEPMFFRLSAENKALRLLVDGKDVGPGKVFTLWRPRVGKHVLTLVDKEKKVLDEIHFSVRGRVYATK